ncbi:MAG: ABC transporter permease [Bacteroidales bacterium]|nr:ABC transporter permease [Bacteroidales bacterium]
MWKNFFNVALRNISKNRIFSFINIAGLAIGLASAILILLFIVKEISFDRFHEYSDRIYRGYVDGNIGDQVFRGAWTSYTMAPSITEAIPEVEDFVRLEVFPQQFVWNNDVRQIEDNVIFADSSFFSIFSIRLLYGDAENVLKKPNSVVITKAKALQYFGVENPLGQTLEFNNKDNFYEVTGVMEAFPDNSHFFCDFLLSMSNIPASRSNNWLTNSIYSYLLLAEGADHRKVEQEMNRVMMKNIRPQLKEILDVTPEEWIEGGNAFGIYLQPLTNIHLNPDIEYGEEKCIRPVNDRTYIYIFALIAFFILVIASINFMNLSTARSAIRAREIAMRKVVGSQRKVLVTQFLLESVLLSFLALVFALLLVELAMPFFNRTMGIDLSFSTIGRGTVLAGVLLLALLLGFLSGIYPAFYLSKDEPLTGLKGGSLRGKGSVLFRSVMVTLQFTISVAIIVGTLVVSKQVSYLVNMDPGFEDENIIVVDRVYPLNNKIGVFCEEAEKIPGVVKASNSSTYLGFSNMSSTFQVKGANRSSNYMFDLNLVDPDFFKTYGLSVWNNTGRVFSWSDPGDTMAVVLNETAVREYGFRDPLNTVIQSPNSEGETSEYKVIGIVKDFHHSSLRKPITPYMFAYKTPSYQQSGFINIRFEKQSRYQAATIRKLQDLWDEMTVNEPFQYFFLDEELNKYYREEERTGRISLVFSILAIFIACLGLLGLTIFNTERRLREIAIRKAMGASLSDLLLIISREILVLLGISILLAWIIAYFFMKNWLQVFPYNVGFTPGIYIIAALVAVFITMITVNAITLKAARSNPVDALYHE